MLSHIQLATASHMIALISKGWRILAPCVEHSCRVSVTTARCTNRCKNSGKLNLRRPKVFFLLLGVAQFFCSTTADCMCWWTVLTFPSSLQTVSAWYWVTLDRRRLETKHHIYLTQLSYTKFSVQLPVCYLLNPLCTVLKIYFMAQI